MVSLRNVNTDSSPSALRITDLRVAIVAKPGPSPCPIIRLDTNQGVYGLGEVRDGASAGKVYNVPIYQMLGGKFRDRIRIYADTDESPDPKVFAQRLKARKEEMGITWLKMDVGINLVEKIPGTVTGPSELTAWERRALPHPFVATEVTEKGIEKLSEFVQAAREAVGMEIPLSMDHVGLGITLNEDVVKRHLAPGTGYFEPTPQWNQERSGDWLWSMAQSPSSSGVG